jgi:hypothetical protein
MDVVIFVSIDICRYARCNFQLELNVVVDDEQQTIPKQRSVILTPFSKFEDFSNIMCECDARWNMQPVVLNRMSSSGIDNPFGSTFCYGYGNAIIEVCI